MNAVDLVGITKHYTQVTANQQVDFEVREGEIHALLGENGAGKTTLMKILYGLSRADEGRILIHGEEVSIQSPHDAIEVGIGMVSQHFTLIPTMTVAENITLGLDRGWVIDPEKIQAEVSAAAEKFGMQVDPRALIRDLSVGERQRVEILKCLFRNARILILDEPTAVLIPQEVDQLFNSLNLLRQQGLSLVFISHKLNEVMQICDRITVLRDGKVIGTVEKGDTTAATLAQMMVGHESFGIARQIRIEFEEPPQPLIRLQGVRVPGKKGKNALTDINLDVLPGEIVAVAGVSGNGQRELAQVLSGTLAPSAGTIRINNIDLTGKPPASFSAAGVGRVPEDRHSGVVGELSVAENLVLERLQDFVTKGALDRKKIHAEALKRIEQYQIKASPEDPVRTLSGGNMQKVLLARALALHPKALIVSQPTRGLDIGASEYVRKRLLEERAKGTAVLMISEDLEEVLTLADRIAVIYEGRITAVLDAADATAQVVGVYMAGAGKEALKDA